MTTQVLPARAGALPPTWVTLGALLALSLASAAAMAPLAAAAYRSAAPELATTVRTGLWLLGVLTPALAALKAAALAGVAWAVLVLVGGSPAFRHLWRTLLVGELVLASQTLFVAAILHLRGVETITSPGDLQLTTGLNLFFPDPATAAGALALAVTPFHLAWLALLVWRFAEVDGSGVGKGALAAVACWLPGPLVAVARTLGG